MKRCLVTGAQGFVGRYLVGRLLQNDPEVEVMGVGRSPAMEGRFSNGSPLPGGLLSAFEEHCARYRYASIGLHDTPALAAMMRDFRPDCVFHMASALHASSERELVETNIEGTLSLMNALSEQPALLVHGSSASVYGQPRSLPIAEDHPCRPVDFYGVSKCTAEQLVAVKAKRARLAYVVARIFNIVGPGQTSTHACGRFAEELVALEGAAHPCLEVGPLSPTRDFVDVRDVSEGLVLMARRGAPGETYNVASGRETAMGEVLRELVRISELEVQVVERGDRPAGVSRHVADVSKLTRLGYRARQSLSQSLDDLLRHQRSLRCGYAR